MREGKGQKGAARDSRVWKCRDSASPPTSLTLASLRPPQPAPLPHPAAPSLSPSLRPPAAQLRGDWNLQGLILQLPP